ncbi:MAG: RNase adapter RapZ [Lachnospiraceae bacterium]|nr:RNase adapter RapZ [Lachnospiraceae bacterium]
MDFVIITGMSGAGKSTALNIMEDIGYHCVDNLPVALLEKFSELLFSDDAIGQKVALGVDSRSGRELEELPEVLDRIREAGRPYRIVFLDSDDQVLVRRYKETRRTHPLSHNSRVDEGIALERERMDFLKERADYIINTDKMLTRDLNMRLREIFVDNREFKSLNISVVSFGFKYGIPQDSDLVFDVRFLPNPYYIPELKPYTGRDDSVHNYVMGFEDAVKFLDKTEDMLRFLLPLYVKEGKNQIVIAIGCTGGKHRSVTLAMELYSRLSKMEEYGVMIEHIDIDKDAKRGK